MNEIKITELKREHCTQVAAIEKAVFSLPWSEKSFLECVESPERHYLCAVLNDEVLGYCGYWNVLDEAEIYNMAVREEARGSGVGKMLLKKLIDYGVNNGRKKFLLEVRIGNKPAIALYKKMGFTEDGIRPGFYDEPKEDALLMSLEVR